MNGGRARRRAMWSLACFVGAVAAIVSYSHIYDLARAHGGTVTASRLLPLSVDALIVVGELMLLHEADQKGRRFRPGWLLVWSGIAATTAANVTYGAQFGLLGALLWGWPAYSFILVAWGMVAIVKRAPVTSGDTIPSPVPSTTEAAAEASLRALNAAGNPWSVNQLQERFSLTRAQATKLRQRIVTESNGHQPEITP